MWLLCLKDHQPDLFLLFKLTQQPVPNGNQRCKFLKE